MQLKNQVEWALHCAAILAGLPEGHYLPANALAELHGVPREYLGKALQSLSQAGLVEGTLGPRGGYRLAKAPGQINFLDVVEAVEGKESTFVCTEIRKNNPCRRVCPDASRRADSKSCGVARVMWAADKAWRRSLAEVSLAALVHMVGRDVPAALLDKTSEWVLART
jgi:Rrf2 family protein